MPCDGQRAAIMYVGHNCELEPNYPLVRSYTLTQEKRMRISCGHVDAWLGQRSSVNKRQEVACNHLFQLLRSASAAAIVVCSQSKLISEAYVVLM